MSVRVANQVDLIERSIAQLASLPAEGASDMHARRPTQAALKGADALLKQISAVEELPEPIIVATPDRGIEFEWRKGQRLFAVNFSPDGTVEIFGTEGGCVVEEASISHVNRRVAALLRWVSEAQAA